MRTGQGEIAEPMIEMVRIEMDDVTMRTAMFLVARTAPGRCDGGNAAMKSAVVGDIASDPRVARDAGRVLRRLRERHVAGETPATQAGVRRAERTRTDDAFQNLPGHDRERGNRDQHGEQREDQLPSHQYRCTAMTCVIAASTRKPNSGR